MLTTNRWQHDERVNGGSCDRTRIDANVIFGAGALRSARPHFAAVSSARIGLPRAGVAARLRDGALVAQVAVEFCAVV